MRIRRGIAWLLAAMFVLTLFPAGAAAATVLEIGSRGEDVT